MDLDARDRRLIGREGSRARLDTPVLVIDLDAFERNLAAMAAFARERGLGLRPHAKTHKCPEIARRQIAAGALGASCAKLGEAEALADEGVTGGLLITSPVVATGALERLVELAGRASDLMTVVDHPLPARALGAMAAARGLQIRVLIDVDPGMGRTGVRSPAAAVELLEAVRGAPGLSYEGVQFYCGAHQHIGAYADRRNAVAERTNVLRSVLAALAEAGGPARIVTGGGTGTHAVDAELGALTELQPGSYLFMDDQYLACELRPDDPRPFETALMVDARVVSANAPGQATVDAGLKAFSTDAGAPTILAGAAPGARYRFMGDEHGAVLAETGPAPRLGERVSLRAPHCDPTVNLYDRFHVVRGGVLVDIWPIAARGRSR